jgi:hypothetical protein
VLPAASLGGNGVNVLGVLASGDGLVPLAYLAQGGTEVAQRAGLSLPVPEPPGRLLRGCPYLVVPEMGSAAATRSRSASDARTAGTAGTAGRSWGLAASGKFFIGPLTRHVRR